MWYGPCNMSVSTVIMDPIIGDMSWMIGTTGWSHDKVARLARRGIIPGAFKALPGQRGDRRSFRKAKTLAWLNSLENASRAEVA